MKRQRVLRKQRVLLCLTVFLAAAYFLTGCMPPNFSKDHAKEIARVHGPEAAGWFEENKPKAKVDGKYRAYSTGTDLYAAVCGNYRENHETYEYLYDYMTGQMYLEEGYKESEALLAQKVAAVLGFPAEKCKVNTGGSTGVLISENDTAGVDAVPQGNETTSKLRYLIPDPLSPEQFADQTFTGGNDNTFYVDAYLDRFPEYDPSLFEKLPNLGNLWYYVPVDCASGYNGAIMEVQTADGCERAYLHIEEISDGFYGGYYYRGDDVIMDDLVITLDGNDLHLEIPEPAAPIFFSAKKQKLESYFTNNGGKLVETELSEMYRGDCPGNPGYYLFSSSYMVKDNVSYAYFRNRIVNSEGVYDFHCK